MEKGDNLGKLPEICISGNGLHNNEVYVRETILGGIRLSYAIFPVEVHKKNGGQLEYYTIASQEILERISRHCPDAISTYLQCINRANAHGKIIFTKKMVMEDMSYSWTKFRNQLKKLALENLLEWHQMTDAIAVTLAVTYDHDD